MVKKKIKRPAVYSQTVFELFNENAKATNNRIVNEGVLCNDLSLVHLLNISSLPKSNPFNGIKTDK